MDPALRSCRSSLLWRAFHLLSITQCRFQTTDLSPCVLQTPILLTPSPLLSSIHFWSTLSPVAPLSPARLQGANTLFQVSSATLSDLRLTKATSFRRHAGICYPKNPMASSGSDTCCLIRQVSISGNSSYFGCLVIPSFKY